MAERSDITPEVLRELLRYDADTGLLFWRERPRSYISDSRQWLAWNAKYAGTQAFASKHCNNYLAGCVLTVRFLAHRVAFAMHHKRWPNGEIDHIDRNPANNRIVNLREVTHAENHRNRGRPRSNTSGLTGISWHKRDRIWRAHASLNGRQIHLGSFATKEAAVSARQTFLKKSGYSSSHGV